jgi:hypothetical protein
MKISPAENALKKQKFYAKLALDVDRSIQYHTSQCRKNAANRGIEFEIDGAYIAKLWKKQKGKCALSKKEMTITHGSTALQNPTKVSIDRIDNTVGYIPGNVQLITWQANAAKSVWSNEQLIEMCKAIAEHNK